MISILHVVSYRSVETGCNGINRYILFVYIVYIVLIGIDRLFGKYRKNFDFFGKKNNYT